VSPFLPVRPRFSTILCKFAPTNFFLSGVTPLEGVTRGGRPPPTTSYSDATALEHRSQLPNIETIAAVHVLAVKSDSVLTSLQSCGHGRLLLVFVLNECHQSSWATFQCRLSSRTHWHRAISNNSADAWPNVSHDHSRTFTTHWLLLLLLEITDAVRQSSVRFNAIATPAIQRHLIIWKQQKIYNKNDDSLDGRHNIWSWLQF